MGRKTLNRQIQNALYDKQAFGESRHAAKAALREQGNYHFGDTDDKIHSVVTFNTYKDACNRFADWLIEEKNVNKYTKFEDCKEYAKQYIEYRLNTDKVSVWTAKMERSALGKLYGERIDVEMPKRDIHEIKRSRGQEKINHFSEEKNLDIVNFARATGCRRSDLLALRPCDFREDKNGNLFVDIRKSKGGRDRTTYVLSQYKDFIKEYIKDKENEKVIFDKVKHHMDVHAYRGEYARALYDEIRSNNKLKSNLLSRYPERHEYKTTKDRETGEKKTVEITSKTLRTRDGETFERDDLYIISQNLGHNRLEICTSHYLH